MAASVVLGSIFVLGAPLFPVPAMDGAWTDRCAEISRAKEKLSMISISLLHASCSTPRVLHLVRCSPSVDHNALQVSFDDTCYSQLTSSDVSDTQRLQASLPVKDVGAR